MHAMYQGPPFFHIHFFMNTHQLHSPCPLVHPWKWAFPFPTLASLSLDGNIIRKIASNSSRSPEQNGERRPN